MRGKDPTVAMVIMVFNHEIIIGPQHRLQNRGKDPAVGVVIVVFSNIIARKEVIIQNRLKLLFSETFWSVEGCDKQDNTNALSRTQQVNDTGGLPIITCVKNSKALWSL